VKQLLTTIVLFMLLALMVESMVQAQDGLEVQLEPMLIDVYGYDEHIGDIVRYKEEYSIDYVGNETLDYGATYKPINLNMKNKFTLGGEVAYKKGQWGLGVCFWWFNTDDSVRGTVTTPEEESTVTEDIYYINSVRMWDNTITPVYNELEDSYFSPVDYWAKDGLKIWTIDFFLNRTLVEKKNSFINFSLGAKLASLKTNENMGQKQRAYYDDYDYGYTFDNHITLESTAEADCSFIKGPFLGFRGKANYGNLAIEGFANQSLLFGTVKQTGLWKDIDDMLYTDLNTGETLWHDVYTGELTFSKEEKIALPVTELKLKVAYYIAENISIGGGGFYSIWWNAPVAPKWSIPGDWTWDEGTGWKLPERTLRFGGLMVGAGVRF